MLAFEMLTKTKVCTAEEGKRCLILELFGTDNFINLVHYYELHHSIGMNIHLLTILNFKKEFLRFFIGTFDAIKM